MQKLKKIKNSKIKIQINITEYTASESIKVHKNTQLETAGHNSRYSSIQK